MSDDLEIRPFTSRDEYEGMIDYFLQGGDSFLSGMGVDPAKLPSRDEWLRAALLDAERPDAEKERFYVGWRSGRELVGHSSISHIVHGSTAHCHLHLWRPDLRRSGMGAALLARSIDVYFERFELKSLASEPFAGNPAPSRTLAKLGFRFVRRYRTVPTAISLEQEVDRYEIGREAWAGRGGPTPGPAPRIAPG